MLLKSRVPRRDGVKTRFFLFSIVLISASALWWTRQRSPPARVRLAWTVCARVVSSLTAERRVLKRDVSAPRGGTRVTLVLSPVVLSRAEQMVRFSADVVLKVCRHAETR